MGGSEGLSTKEKGFFFNVFFWICIRSFDNYTGGGGLKASSIERFKFAASLYVCAIDKVYIDGPRGSKTLAGGLLFSKRVSHATHFYKQDQQEQCVWRIIVGLWNLPTQMF